MKNFLPKLPGDKFIRVHKSFIVSINKIISVKRKTLEIEGKEIPIGETYKHGLLNHLNIKLN